VRWTSIVNVSFGIQLRKYAGTSDQVALTSTAGCAANALQADAAFDAPAIWTGRVAKRPRFIMPPSLYDCSFYLYNLSIAGTVRGA
jgi:hypothetical protein